MIAGKSDEAESAALRFSLAALFVVMTAVAALFASAGLKAIFLLPLLVAAGFLIALGRLIESRGGLFGERRRRTRWEARPSRL